VRLVKRVVAVPGDKLELRDNQLLINGQAAIWKPVGQREDDEQGTSFIVEETLYGKTHDVMFAPQNPAMRSYGPLIVPPGRYFVMGDNRDNSNDSRYIGMIERRRIVGKATAVAFSLDRKHWFRPRLHRFFKGIN
jgi:signal peptidase I